jgi:hypothetical protein
MTRQGLRQLVHHGQAWCEETYYLGLDFCEVLRGTLLGEGSLFLFSGSFAQWRQALIQLGGAVHTRGKRVRDRLRVVSAPHACHPLPKGVGH